MKTPGGEVQEAPVPEPREPYRPGQYCSPATRMVELHRTLIPGSVPPQSVPVLLLVDKGGTRPRLSA